MSVVSKEQTLEKLKNQDYRDEYAEACVKVTLPWQIQMICKHLGVDLSITQKRVERGDADINDLLETARIFDCGLLVKFVPFERLLDEFEDVSPEALIVEGFEEKGK